MTRRLLLALLLLWGTAACTRAEASGFDNGRLQVVTAFYPLEFLAQRIGGPDVTVTQLTKPGAEPHDIELTPAQVGAISDAGLVVHLAGFQPAVDEAVRQQAADRAFDAATAVDLLPAAEHAEEHAEEAGGEHAEEAGEHAEAGEGMDPHVWLDPARFATLADRLAERLAQADPAHAAGYTERARALRTDLETLDTEYAARLKTCARDSFVTSHTAFTYLAQRYGLTEIGITGISPEAEPTAQRLADVAHRARAAGATTIFFETLVSPKVAETIAREVGARTAVLDPIEGLTQPGTDYLSVMRSNLTALGSALGCAG